MNLPHLNPKKITPEQREAMRRDVACNVRRACAQFGYTVPRRTIDFNSLEGITRIKNLHCAGFSHSVIAILLGSKRKSVQTFLASLRKEAGGKESNNFRVSK